MDNFSSLEMARGGKVRKFKGSVNKGHRREMELTINAIRSGGKPPIPFDELVEVSEATFLAQEAVRVCPSSLTAVDA